MRICKLCYEGKDMPGKRSTISPLESMHGQSELQHVKQHHFLPRRHIVLHEHGNALFDVLCRTALVPSSTGSAEQFAELEAHCRGWFKQHALYGGFGTSSVGRVERICLLAGVALDMWSRRLLSVGADTEASRLWRAEMALLPSRTKYIEHCAKTTRDLERMWGEADPDEDFVNKRVARATREANSVTNWLCRRISSGLPPGMPIVPDEELARLKASAHELEQLRVAIWGDLVCWVPRTVKRRARSDGRWDAGRKRKKISDDSPDHPSKRHRS